MIKNKKFNDSFEDIEDETQSVEIIVNIGGKQKMIMAYLDEEPEDIAVKFIQQEGIDMGLKDTLTALIADQMQ